MRRGIFQQGIAGRNPMNSVRTLGGAQELVVVVNKRADAYDVYIGRPSKYGNPFSIGVHGTREAVIMKFKRWFLSTSPQAESLREDALRELPGKRLGCFCKPANCHGDVIAGFVNGYIGTRR